MTPKLLSGPRTSFSRCLSRILLLVCCVVVCSGCVTQTTNLPRSDTQLSLNEARKTRSNPSIAAGNYLDAAESALRSSNRTSGETATNSRLAYNSACQELAVLLQSNRELWDRTETIRSSEHTYRLHFASGSRQAGTWDPTYLDFFRIPKRMRRQSQPSQANSWGGVLVGVHKPADPRKYFLPRVGLAVPVTAIVEIAHPASSDHGVLDATFDLYNPNRRATIKLAGVPRPLNADYAAVTAYYPHPLLLGLYAMFRPESYQDRAGLYLLEPYDPDRIPVIFIHGLLSIPQMWAPTINAIQADPELRNRFQFWVFAYPTGNPIALSALRLRESLAQVYQIYPRAKGMILIAHSMGGLLAQMQAVNSGRALWNDVFQDDADRLFAASPPDNLVKKALIFDANPHVKRIVFICVPHRGSYLAVNWIGSLGVWLIRLPGELIAQAGNELSVPILKNYGLKHPPTGINGLSPRNPVLHALDTLPITVPYHSIIGDRGRSDTPNSSDGVVPYWSSHLAGAQSELIVPGPHGSFALPQTVAELKRTLRLHLTTLGRSDSSVTPEKARSAPAGDGRRMPTARRSSAIALASLNNHHDLNHNHFDRIRLCCRRPAAWIVSWCGSSAAASEW